MSYLHGPDGYSTEDCVFPGEDKMSEDLRAAETAMLLWGESVTQLIGGNVQDVPHDEELFENHCTQDTKCLYC